MVKPCAGVTVFFLLIIPVGGPVQAQDYSFSIPEFVCNVSIEEDRSLFIYYSIEFFCNYGAHSIDIIDIGFPGENYELSSISAEIDGFSLSDIRPSTCIPVGVEVHLGSYAINPGHSGVFMLSGRNPNMVFRDTNYDEYASVEFSATWFDENLTTGTSDYVLRIQFPPGAEPGSVRYHDYPYSVSYVTEEGRVVYEWQWSWTPVYEYTVGVSFPDSLVSGKLTERPVSVYTSTRSSAGTRSGSMFIIMPFFSVPILIIILISVFNLIRKNRYLPPRIGIEGVGVKRGLTAPMVALLMEKKFDRVFALIIYGLIHKKILKPEISEKGSGLVRISRSEDQTIQLRDYEKKLMDSFSFDMYGKVSKIDSDLLKGIFVDMIENLQKKMKSFSAKETKDYYRYIIEKAWRKVKNADSERIAAELLEDQFQWLMLDRDYKEKSADISGIYVPVHHYWVGGSSVTGNGGMSISQFCNQVAGTLESAANSIVGSFSGLTSSVTSVTNPVPSSGGSYRSGSGCACACAGCACACAGGGR